MGVTMRKQTGSHTKSSSGRKILRHNHDEIPFEENTYAMDPVSETEWDNSASSGLSDGFGEENGISNSEQTVELYEAQTEDCSYSGKNMAYYPDTDEMQNEMDDDSSDGMHRREMSEAIAEDFFEEMPSVSKECKISNERKGTNAGLKHRNKKQIVKAAVIVVVIAVLALMGITGLKQAKSLKNQAGIIKTDLKAVAVEFKKMNSAGAITKIDQMDKDLSGALKTINSPLWRVASVVPIAGKEIRSARILLQVLDDVSQQILRPGAELIGEYPISFAKKNKVTDEEIVNAYIDFYRGIMPVMDDAASDMSNIRLRIADPDGKLTQYVKTFVTVERLLKEMDEPLVQPILEFLEENPPTRLRGEDGFNPELLSDYISFANKELAFGVEYFQNMNTKQLKKYLNIDNFNEIYDELCTLGDFAVKAFNELIAPMSDLVVEYPICDLKKEGELNLLLTEGYIDYIQKVVPTLRTLLEEFRGISLPNIDENGRISKYADKVDGFLVDYDLAEGYLPLLYAFIGDGNRFYVITAQNSAEIRASGGFPGAVGSITIENGVMKIGDFTSVYDVFTELTPKSAGLTYAEENLFGSDTTKARDACFIPDFERVGEIWAKSYEEFNNVKVDGVISLTPVIIQDLLGACGSIKLDNDVVLDGTNAATYLQHDVYYQYYENGKKATYRSADEVFSDTAKKTMDKVMKGLSVRDGADQAAFRFFSLITTLQNRTADRNIMLWFADRESENLVRSLGWSGGLSHDEDNPATGLYYSCYYASKLGWFLDLHYNISEPVVNEDDTRSYKVTVTFSNIMTEEEVEKGSKYIIGPVDGKMSGRVHLFAPAGGSITEFKTLEKKTSTVKDEYQGLEVTLIYVHLRPGETITATYTVTTAPEVAEPLRMEMTPTLTEYHNTGAITELPFSAG